MLGFEGSPLPLDTETRHRVPCRLRHERIADEVRSVLVPALDREPGDPGRPVLTAVGPERSSDVRAIQPRGDPDSPDLLAVGERDVHARLREARGGERLTHRVLARKDLAVEKTRVVVVEEVPLVVPSKAPLPAEGRRLGDDPAARQPEAPLRLCVVDPAVGPGQERVLLMLRARPGKRVGAQPPLLVASIVSGRVAAEPEVLRFGDQDTLGQHPHGAREDEAVGEDAARVHPAIPVDVFEQSDLSDGALFVSPFDVPHVAAHLDHVEPTPIVPVDRDRIDDEGLRGDQLDPEALRDTEGLERFVGLELRRRGPLDRGEDLFGIRTAKDENDDRPRGDESDDEGQYPEQNPPHPGFPFLRAARRSASGRRL